MVPVILFNKYYVMSATGTEAESATVREEGLCEEDKIAKGKQLLAKSEESTVHRDPGLV